MARKIAVFNQKGGVGKTTTNINLSACLAAKGKKVLVVDIDPQGNTTSGFGIDKKELDETIYELILDKDMDEKAVIIQTKFENLDIIPSSMQLAGAEIELANIQFREKRLKTILEKVEDLYDYVFIDCPPSLGLLTINSLVAADSVLIPIQCEFYALEGVSQLVNTVNLVRKSLNADLEIQGILLSMFDGRTNLSVQVVEEVTRFFKGKVYETRIPRNVRLAEAPSYGLPIIYYDARSRGAKAYMDFSEEFLNLEEEDF